MSTPEPTDPDTVASEIAAAITRTFPNASIFTSGENETFDALFNAKPGDVIASIELSQALDGRRLSTVEVTRVIGMEAATFGEHEVRVATVVYLETSANGGGNLGRGVFTIQRGPYGERWMTDDHDGEALCGEYVIRYSRASLVEQLEAARDLSID